MLTAPRKPSASPAYAMFLTPGHRHCERYLSSPSPVHPFTAVRCEGWDPHPHPGHQHHHPRVPPSTPTPAPAANKSPPHITHLTAPPQPPHTVHHLPPAHQISTTKVPYPPASETTRLSPAPPAPPPSPPKPPAPPAQKFAPVKLTPGSWVSAGRTGRCCCWLPLCVHPSIGYLERPCTHSHASCACLQCCRASTSQPVLQSVSANLTACVSDCSSFCQWLQRCRSEPSIYVQASHPNKHSLALR